MKTWELKFMERPDFQFLQKIQSDGYESLGLPDDIYRIIDISYEYADGGATNITTVTIMADTYFQLSLSLKRIYYDIIWEIQAMAKSLMDSVSNEVGVVTAVSGTEITYKVPVKGSLASPTVYATKTGIDPSGA